MNEGENRGLRLIFRTKLVAKEQIPKSDFREREYKSADWLDYLQQGLQSSRISTHTYDVILYSENARPI